GFPGCDFDRGERLFGMRPPRDLAPFPAQDYPGRSRVAGRTTVADEHGRASERGGNSESSVPRWPGEGVHHRELACELALPNMTRVVVLALANPLIEEIFDLQVHAQPGKAVAERRVEYRQRRSASPMRKRPRRD